MNERAWAAAEAALLRTDKLRITAHTLSNGTRVLDAGINTRGGVGAGLLLADLCMGGLGNVSLTSVVLGESTLPAVQVWTDHPATACMASQYAGWAISHEGFFAMGSGPLRAMARTERELFERLDYHEHSQRGVLVLEGRTLPTAEVADLIAAKAAVPANALILAIAPTASLAGGIQVVARSIETGLHKLDALGFDVRRVISASGSAPVPPVAKSDLRAIGRTNDCVLYGARVDYTVDASDDTLASIVAALPSSSSRDYGTPFYEVFKRYDNDFYKVDPMLFSPASVRLTSAATGRTFAAGSTNADILRRSLFEN